MGNPYLDSGLWPKTHHDSELTASTFQLPPAHQFGPEGTASHVGVTNLSLTVTGVLPGVIVHSNGFVYVFFFNGTCQRRSPIRVGHFPRSG
jgi:hypothetical protein